MTTTIDPAEVAKFEAMAAEWWDPNGKFKPLHMLNPCRLDYITSQIAAEFDRDVTQALPFKGLRILDIGCGGGLLSEPMARLGAEVVGADAADIVEETLASALLKSNCPVTGQPDWGSVVVEYRGSALDHASLLAYLVSFRQHADFHEQCVERIFLDLQRLLKPEWLTVYARYVRRGGLDINPYRSSGSISRSGWCRRWS